MHFTAFYDGDAGVWVARSEIDRITVEGPTQVELETKLRRVVPDVLESRGQPARDIDVEISWQGTTHPR